MEKTCIVKSVWKMNRRMVTAKASLKQDAEVTTINGNAVEPSVHHNQPRYP